ncbi:uncharacterized protein V6R79_006533 [Siganus canaliculatus]
MRQNPDRNHGKSPEKSLSQQPARQVSRSGTTSESAHGTKGTARNGTERHGTARSEDEDEDEDEHASLNVSDEAEETCSEQQRKSGRLLKEASSVRKRPSLLQLARLKNFVLQMFFIKLSELRYSGDQQRVSDSRESAQ